MGRTNVSDNRKELTALCWKIRELMEQSEYQTCEELIEDAMAKHPHAPEPHNLLGLLLEKQEDHLTAMKHFRAAYALDPAYVPARHNLDRFGSFYPKGKWAYDESDCPQEKRDAYKIEYDARGIGHVIRGD